MEQTLGYMYYNGFYALLKQEEEYLFNRYIIQSLNRGFKIIKDKDLSMTPVMNESIANSIIEKANNPLGNVLILNRELTTHNIDLDKVKSNDITYRLFQKKELLESLNTGADNHYMLYFSVNTKTEMSLINVKTGNVIYAKQFDEGYTNLKPKEIKLIAKYF